MGQAVKPGETFDRYRIEAVLGEGGMGHVYRAYDTRLHRNVALKVVRLDETAEQEAPDHAARRMLREARAAAALDHPNAVSVYDVGEVDDTLFLAMEFISGKTLRTLIAEGRAPWEARVRWLVQIARALAAAHRHGLVHRDIKPENVMVRSDGMVKVLDFGIAKRVDVSFDMNGERVASLTGAADGIVVGTPRYMSPEQVRGEKLDARSDQFSWGVVAYETLTSKLPWPASDGVELLLAVVGTEPESLATLIPDVPSLVAATVTRALAKSPDDRFAEMGEIASALEPYMSTSMRVASAGHDDANETTKTDIAPFRAREDVSRTTIAPAKARGTRWRFVAGAAALSLASAVAAMEARPLTEAARPPPPPVPTAVTDAPPPSSTNADARAAYAAGLQSFRDAAFESARRSLEKATSLDPSLAAAHLRLALLDLVLASDELVARRAFGDAFQRRASLQERDQAILDAFDARFRREPPDFATTEDRVTRLTERFPMDAEIAFYLGFVRLERGRFPMARVALERSVELDPKFGEALSYLALVLSFQGDLAGARRTIDRCLESCPAATDCLWNRVLLHEQAGACEALELDVRQWIARAPDDYYGYQMLGKALLSERRPLEAVLAALEQKWAHVPVESRRRFELGDRTRLAIFAGDFVRAEAYAKELDAAVASDPGVIAHSEPLLYLSEIYDETGRAKKAREIATKFLERKGAWVPPVDATDFAMSLDPTPQMLALLARQSGLTPAEYRAKRAEWLAAWKTRTTEAFVPHLWIYGYAHPALSEDDAKEAMEALPAFSPLPPFTPQGVAGFYIGRTFFLAGRADEGLAHLAHAARTCTEYNAPFDHTRAHYYLGLALAKAGRAAEACTAFGVVLERWGNATPPSRTATLAKTESAKLACKRP